MDPILHAQEIARFNALVVGGPGPEDCWIFTGPISGHGYGRFWIRREGGPRIMLRANRYPLAGSHQRRGGATPSGAQAVVLRRADRGQALRVSTGHDAAHMIAARRSRWISIARRSPG